MLLDPLNRGIWYLRECCVRQLRGFLAIPDNPPKEWSYISREIYFDHVRAISWPSIDRFYVEVQQQKYNEYWTNVSGIRLIPPMMRYTNTDAIGTAAVLGMDVTLPCTPPNPNTIYPTQLSFSSNTQSANIYWSYRIATSDAATTKFEIERHTSMVNVPPSGSHTRDEWRFMYGEALYYGNELCKMYFQEIMKLAVELQSKNLLMREKDSENLRLKAKIEQLRSASAINSADNYYRPSMDGLNASNQAINGNYGYVGFATLSAPSYQSVDYGFTQFTTSSG